MSPQKYIILTVPEIVSPEGGGNVGGIIVFPGWGKTKIHS